MFTKSLRLREDCFIRKLLCLVQNPNFWFMLYGPALLKAFHWVCVCRKVLSLHPPPPPINVHCTWPFWAHTLLACPLVSCCEDAGTSNTLFSRITGCLHFPALCSEKSDEHHMVFCQQLCYEGNCVNVRPQCVAEKPLCQIPYVCTRPGRPSYIL